MIKQCRLVALIGLYFFIESNVFAAADTTKYYRYINEKGELILSNQIPPDDVGRGYDVLNKRGEVQEKVEPTLSEEQREAKAAEEARKENDKKLMSLYASYDDIDRARDLIISQLDASIIIIEESINGQIRRREKFQDSAADLERSGKVVPADTAQKLFDIDKNIKHEEKKLVEQKETKKKLTNTFAADRIRLGELRQLAKPTALPKTELQPLALPGNTSGAVPSSNP